MQPDKPHCPAVSGRGPPSGEAGDPFSEECLQMHKRNHILTTKMTRQPVCPTHSSAPGSRPGDRPSRWGRGDTAVVHLQTERYRVLKRSGARTQTPRTVSPESTALSEGGQPSRTEPPQWPGAGRGDDSDGNVTRRGSAREAREWCAWTGELCVIPPAHACGGAFHPRSNPCILRPPHSDFLRGPRQLVSPQAGPCRGPERGLLPCSVSTGQGGEGRGRPTPKGAERVPAHRPQGQGSHKHLCPWTQGDRRAPSPGRWAQNPATLSSTALRCPRRHPALAACGRTARGRPRPGPRGVSSFSATGTCYPAWLSSPRPPHPTLVLMGSESPEGRPLKRIRSSMWSV